MPIPDFQTIMLPLLKFSGDKKEHSLRQAIEFLADKFNLTEEERKELLPSGQQATFDNRVGWARTYMLKAGLLESTKRGYFNIAERGLKVLSEKPEKIDIRVLERFKEFVEFRKKKKERKKKTPVVDESLPEEVIESAYQSIREDLAFELLKSIKGCSPSFFERLVVDLLVKMGYGGTRKDAGQATRKTADGGIDGIIKEDRLGLDIVYIQAKRWENTVGRPEIQKFAGALQGMRAKKGIFITTSNFSRDAEDYVKNIDSKIVLIDGELLADFMIDHNIGVSAFASYEVKRIDQDYFTED